MPDASNPANDIARWHKLVETGSVEDLRRAINNAIDVNAPGHAGQTALMVAIAKQDIEKMRLLIDAGADLELADDFNDTPLAHAVNYDFAAGVALLIELGVDRGYNPKYPLKPVDYDPTPLVEMGVPAELRGVLSEEEWRESIEMNAEVLDQLGANPSVQPRIGDVQSIEVLKLFLTAGDELSLADAEVKREYIGLGNGGAFTASEQEYRQNKLRRFGTANPERMDNPFWCDMIRMGSDAYVAREYFNDASPFDDPGAVWCYDRFGTTLTPLGDGRFVQIGGEHEDFYDPDFCIYNDVVVHDGQGNFEIYGYPKDVFPPTDFQTATLVGDWIYVIGCLGYVSDRREGETPVYRLHLGSWKIEPVETSGPSPGWISRHRAVHDSDRKVIHVERGERHEVGKEGEPELVDNAQRFELDLSTNTWRRLE